MPVFEVVEIGRCPSCLVISCYSISPSYLRCYDCGAIVSRSDVADREYRKRTSTVPFIEYTRDEAIQI